MIRMTVRVARRDAEPVLAELLTLAPAGVEERERECGELEYVLYGAPGELPSLPVVHAAAGGTFVEVATEEIPDTDWTAEWRTHHPPVDIAGGERRLRVRPPWARADPDPGTVDVVIEPGQAFGTGAHQTTRLTLQLLLGLEPAGALADWGTGSGVLAIAAAKLGYAPVSACDHERPALEATRAAAAANGVAVPELGRVDLRREPGPWAPTVTANLVGPLLLEVAARLTRPPERLIVSGLLRHEADEVAQAFAHRHGLGERERATGGEWTALLLALS